MTLKKWRIRCCCPNNAFQLPEKKMHPPPRVGRFTLFVSQRCAEEEHGNIHFKSGPEKTCEKCASLNRAIINFSLAPHCCHTVCPFSGHHRAYGHMKWDEMRQTGSSVLSIDSSTIHIHYVWLLCSWSSCSAEAHRCLTNLRFYGELQILEEEGKTKRESGIVNQ